jgi:D-alanyl-lipoteichoic acid acyltransferase DltB (MBOAT superfamily)
MTVDSAQFVGVAAALTLALRIVPSTTRAPLYAVSSALVLATLVPNVASAVFAVTFVLLPFVAIRLLTAQRARVVPTIIFAQTALVLWARKYFLAWPGTAGCSVLQHSVALVGISYMVLRQVDWLLWRQANPDEQASLTDYVGFILGLFSLLAGPVTRYEPSRRSLSASIEPLSPLVSLGSVNRIVNGYLKLALMAPLLEGTTSLEFLRAHAGQRAALVFAFYLYPFAIYLNFAGYTDVVLGFGRLAGLALPENFDRPFLSTNVQEFWHRWHMSFSSWARDYIFYPLLRMLRTRWFASSPAAALAMATAATFLFVGLWHGPTLSFVLFGALHGMAVYLVGPYSRFLEGRLPAPALRFYQASPVARALRTVVCFHFLCATIALFGRSPSELWALVRP